MKKIIVILTIILAIIIPYLFSDIHQIYLPTASGIVAKQVCSLHFISGFSQERARNLYLDPLAGEFAEFIFSDIQASEQTVKASVLGLYQQKAVFREGIGCSLIHDGDQFNKSLTLPLSNEFKPLDLDHSHRDAHFDSVALDSALTTYFSRSYLNTLAVTVLHNGNLVAEKYADGITAATPLHGWSMSKSLTATLAGALVLSGEVDLNEKGVLERPELRDITLDHLLRMTSGLELTENNGGWDPNSRMLFTQSDMAEWAKRQSVLHKAGEDWSYMSGNTILAMRVLQNQLGNNVVEQLSGLRERIFEPLEMNSAIIETDEAGNIQGSSYMYASAHDWARLGQLYLDGGLADDKRIISEDWIEVVSTPTSGSGQGYGLGFWLERPEANAPAEGISMNGFQGQIVYIFPEQDLIIVRLGATNFSDPGVNKLAVDVLNSMKSPDD